MVRDVEHSHPVGDTVDELARLDLGFAVGERLEHGLELKIRVVLPDLPGHGGRRLARVVVQRGAGRRAQADAPGRGLFGVGEADVHRPARRPQPVRVQECVVQQALRRVRQEQRIVGLEGAVAGRAYHDAEVVVGGERADQVAAVPVDGAAEVPVQVLQVDPVLPQPPPRDSVVDVASEVDGARADRPGRDDVLLRLVAASDGQEQDQ